MLSVIMSLASKIFAGFESNAEDFMYYVKISSEKQSIRVESKVNLTLFSNSFSIQFNLRSLIDFSLKSFIM